MGRQFGALLVRTDAPKKARMVLAFFIVLEGGCHGLNHLGAGLLVCWIEPASVRNPFLCCISFYAASVFMRLHMILF